MATNNDDLVKCVKRMFDSEDGKRVMEYLEEQYYNHIPYTGIKPIDPIKLALREGQRSVVYDLKSKVKEKL